MFGSRFFTFFTVALAGSTIVSAAAGGALAARTPGSGAVEAVAAKRQDSVEAQVFAVLTQLKSTVDPLVANINAVVASGDITDETVDPHVIGITDAFNVASAALATIEPGTSLSAFAARQTNDELANLLAGIINDVVGALNPLLASLATLPLLSGLLAGLDVALNQVLLGLSVLLKGVLNLVAQLLVNVAALLRNLALGLTLGTLGF